MVSLHWSFWLASSATFHPSDEWRLTNERTSVRMHTINNTSE
nr:MAG TPA: hypothetical protein [Caudoviricetes sp.]